MTVYVRCTYNRAAHKGGHGHEYQKHFPIGGSILLRQCRGSVTIWLKSR